MTPVAPAPASGRTPAIWFVYGMLAVFSALQAALGPLMPMLRAELDLSYTVGGLHPTAFALGMIVAGLVGASALRHGGRRRVAEVGTSGLGVGLALLVAGTHAAMTISGALLMGIFGTLLMVLAIAVTSDVPSRQRPVIISEAGMAASLAATSVPLLIGLMVMLGVGWRGFALVPTLCALLLLWNFRATDLTPAHAPVGPAGTALPPLSLVTWLYLSALMLGVGLEWCLAIWSAGYLEVGAGLPRDTAATLMSVFFGAGVLARWLASRLARHFSSPTLLVGALALTVLGFLVFWLAPLPWLNVGGLFLAGMGAANLFTMAMATTLDSAPARAETVGARITLLSGLAMLSMPLLLGRLADALGIFLAFGLVLVLAALMLGLLLAASTLAAGAPQTREVI